MNDLPFELIEGAIAEFKNPQATEPIRLPKWGSCTYAEELRIIPLLNKRSEKDAHTTEEDLGFMLSLAVISMRRIDPSFSEDKARKMPMPLLNELGKFILDERSGKAEEAEETPKSSAGRTTKRKSEKAPAAPTGD